MSAKIKEKIAIKGKAAKANVNAVKKAITKVVKKTSQVSKTRTAVKPVQKQVKTAIAAKKPVVVRKPVVVKKPVVAKKLAVVRKPVIAKKQVAAKKLVVVKKPVVAKELAVVKKPVVANKSGAKNSVLEPLGIKPYILKDSSVYMDKEQLKHFEKILNLWKSQLMAEVDRTIYDLQGISNYPDPIDRASQEEEFNLKLRERDRDRRLLKKIGEALERIQDGSYGYCDECGAEIGIRRLEVRPTATQCIECKTIAEIREKQIGS